MFIGTRRALLRGAAPAAPQSLLLDQLSTNAYLAFSTRKLRAAYSGKPLKVTTSAVGNATQDIGFDGSDNLDTATLASFIGSNSGSINTMYDQSTSVANGAGPVTISQQPVIVNSGTNVIQNGHVCLQFATNSFHVITTAALPAQQNQPFIAALCFITLDITQGYPVFDNTDDNGSNTTSLEVFPNGGSAYRVNSGTQRFGGSPDNTTPHSVICIFDTAGAGSQIILDGTNVISNSNIGTNPMRAVTYFIGSDAGFGFGNMNLCEAIFLPGNSLTDAATIRSSWQSYWGVP